MKCVNKKQINAAFNAAKLIENKLGSEDKMLYFVKNAIERNKDASRIALIDLLAEYGYDDRNTLDKVDIVIDNAKEVYNQYICNSAEERF